MYFDMGRIFVIILTYRQIQADIINYLLSLTWILGLNRYLLSRH